MAENWPWESSFRAAAAASTSSTQQQTPTSPLQSGSSQSSHEVGAAVELQGTRGEGAQEATREAANRPTLVEALRTCLTSTTTASTAPLPARSISDPGPQAAALRQSPRSGGGPVSGPGSRTGMKRRSRASRRVPTTVVEATSSDFRETVHRLTGIATPTPSPPVRPQPQRASAATFMRPTPLVQSASVPPHSSSVPPRRPQLLNSLLNITAGAPPPVPPALWHHPQQPRSSDVQQPLFNPFVTSEALERIETEIGAPSSQVLLAGGLASSTPQSVAATTGSTQTWWGGGDHEQAQIYILNPTTTAPFDGSGPSEGPILQAEFDDWLHQDHSGSDYMR